MAERGLGRIFASGTALALVALRLAEARSNGKAAERARAEQPGRGRQATRPGEIPAPGWRDILFRVNNELSRDNVSVIAAGVGFYALLSIFPAFAAALAIYGIWADPQTVQEQLASLGGMLPGEAKQLLEGQLSELAAKPKEALSFGAIAALALALWSASAATKSLMAALNIAYGEEDKRSFIRYNLTALLLTLGGIIGVLLALTAVVVLPAIFDLVGLGKAVEWTLAVLRWPLLAMVVMFGLAVLYRYGPSRDRARWQWVSWGAVVATVLWLLGSALFSIYVGNFAEYDKTYGTLGAVVILLMWFYLTAYVIILGAELNAEMEHQTARDTTEGPEQPLGARRAVMADHVAETP